MATLTLDANYRCDMSKGRMKAVRRDGFVTASIFGHDSEPVSVEVKLTDLVKKIKTSEAGMMSLIDLKIKGSPEKCDGTVIIKEFFKDPLTRKVLDVQFQRVSMKEKINMAVPIVALGEARGVKDGGILEQVMDELDVRCLPSDIPSRIEVDVSDLAIGDHVSVSQVALGEAVEILADPEALIFTCVPPHVIKATAEEEEAAAVAAAAAAEAEVAEAEAPQETTEEQ
jgi:large subunit ribosomal protein L25